jgi:polyhydroxyalkanoate synthesis regulator phasin
MDEPASDPSDERDTLDRLITLLGPRFDDARSLLEGATSRWRGDATRVGETTKDRIQDLARDFGLVTRDQWDELELRVAQMEHRLRLLEDAADNPQHP